MSPLILWMRDNNGSSGMSPLIMVQPYCYHDFQGCIVLLLQHKSPEGDTESQVHLNLQTPSLSLRSVYSVSLKCSCIAWGRKRNQCKKTIKKTLPVIMLIQFLLVGCLLVPSEASTDSIYRNITISMWSQRCIPGPTIILKFSRRWD